MNPREAVAGLSRGMQVFLLVDVLLVVLMVVLLATLPRAGAQADAAPAPAPSAPTAVATPDAVGSTTFALPSGNIACEMAAEGVVCSIGSYTYAAPPVTGCEGTTGHVVRLDSDGFRFVCEDGEEPTRVEADAELGYGQRETVGDYTCASGTDGVTCTDAAGVGFRLARAQWNALP